MTRLKFVSAALGASLCLATLNASAGDVTIINPTACDINVLINNGPAISLPATSSSANWAPSPVTATLSSENPAPGEFGPLTSLVFSATSGYGTAHLDLTIPPNIADESDVQLYVFYCGSEDSASYVAATNGYIFSSGKFSDTQ